MAETGYPMVETHHQVEKIDYPWEETHYPMAETGYPVEETHDQVEEPDHPVVETAYPVEETRYPVASMFVLCLRLRGYEH